MSAAAADSVTVQANTSPGYGIKPRLFFLTTDPGWPDSLSATLMAGQALAHPASGEPNGATTTLPWAIELWYHSATQPTPTNWGWHCSFWVSSVGS